MDLVALVLGGLVGFLIGRFYKHIMFAIQSFKKENAQINLINLNSSQRYPQIQ